MLSTLSQLSSPVGWTFWFVPRASKSLRATAKRSLRGCFFSGQEINTHHQLDIFAVSCNVFFGRKRFHHYGWNRVHYLKLFVSIWRWFIFHTCTSNSKLALITSSNIKKYFYFLPTPDSVIFPSIVQYSIHLFALYNESKTMGLCADEVTFSFRKHCTLVNLFPPYNSSGIIKYYCFDVKTIQNSFKLNQFEIDIWTISPIGYFQIYVFRES